MQYFAFLLLLLLLLLLFIVILTSCYFLLRQKHIFMYKLFVFCYIFIYAVYSIFSYFSAFLFDWRQVVNKHIYFRQKMFKVQTISLILRCKQNGGSAFYVRDFFEESQAHAPLQLSLWWSTSHPSQSSRSKPSLAAWPQTPSPVSAYWSAWQILMNFS
jgi:hypothetical protein